MKLIKIGLILLLVLLIAYQVLTDNRTQKNSGNAPIISSDVDEIRIPCQYDKEDLLQGLTAYDAEDGYITDRILIGGFSDFTEQGVSSLEYAVYDKDGNIAVFNRKVVFSDYVPPRITMPDPWVFRPTDSIYNIPSLNLEGSDMLDGDISKHILITSADLDFSEPGKYTASVYLKNSFGDEVNMELPIHVLDPGQYGYVIELTEPLIYVGRGETIRPEQYVAAVRNEYTGETIPAAGYELTIHPYDDTSEDEINDGSNEYTGETISAAGYKLTIHSFVDTSEDGIYEIQFSAVSSDKAQRGETWMTVVVGDYGG